MVLNPGFVPPLIMSQDLVLGTGDPRLIEQYNRNPVYVDSWAYKNAINISQLNSYELETTLNISRYAALKHAIIRMN